MAHFVKVARLAHLPPGAGMMVVGPFDKPMAPSTWTARSSPSNAVCPHRGGPLANGPLEGHVVACPWHGWTFDVRTGRPDHPGGHCVAAYEVEVRRRDIYVGWIKA
ncbi:MAG TPA: Rieske 2Fe-2S domain-containing protein [Gemmatimonadales bacterium]|nr:Rieske 2Fe-2S domain-containing protein [Gemmatimonadales bacterium]